MTKSVYFLNANYIPLLWKYAREFGYMCKSSENNEQKKSESSMVRILKGFLKAFQIFKEFILNKPDGHSSREKKLKSYVLFLC